MTSQTVTPEQLEYLRADQPGPGDPFSSTSDSPLLPLLASLDRAQLSQLMTECHYQTGEIVFREGESGDAVYLIWSGRVAVVKGDFDSPTVLGYRGPGETIGEMALLDDQPRSGSIVALEKLRLLRIGREGFHAWLHSSPAISMSVMASLSARLRMADNVRTADGQAERQLMHQVTRLESEKEELLELQRVRQETSDLIVHDLRNPLGIIYGALSMLGVVLPEDVLEANRELLDLAVSACSRMQRLVDSLLDVARLESGEIRLNRAAANLRPMIEEAINRVAINSQTREITMWADLPDDLPAVELDFEKIDRVLANLVDNALKYTPAEGEIVLAIEVSSDAVVISVTDTGPGIPPDQKQRIFERFAQVEGDRLAHGRRGFGLGLTFCQLAVQAHGGEIWVEDGPEGVGSRFAFLLPLS